MNIWAVFFSYIIPSPIYLLIEKARKWGRKLMLMASDADNVLMMSIKTTT